MRNALAGLLLSIVALNASAQTSAKAPGAPKVAIHSADERAVLETELKFESESEKRGAEAWYDFADENVSKPGAAHNRDELRAVMAKSYAQRGFKLTWQPVRVQVVGDLGIVNGKYQLHSGENTRTGSYVTIWQRQRDGTWKFIFDAGSPDK